MHMYLILFMLKAGYFVVKFRPVWHISRKYGFDACMIALIRFLLFYSLIVLGVGVLSFTRLAKRLARDKYSSVL
jgi:hypothetical protein